MIKRILAGLTSLSDALRSNSPFRGQGMAVESSGNSDPTGLIAEFFDAHGISMFREGDWAFSSSDSPALAAYYKPLGGYGLLEVHIIVADNTRIVESFAGFGDGEVGLHDAVKRFVSNDLHVLLAAFWGVAEPATSTVEKWEIGGKDYDVYLGDYGFRLIDDPEITVPDDLVIKLEQQIRQNPLDGGVHWFRLFLAQSSGHLDVEALWDNEIWPGGLEVLNSFQWPIYDESYYSVRLFGILREA
ncbi:MAG: hypothetical protein DRR42_21720 [Gammaproteobacteria bacterium]|nr:MAG: hypothetical protein DRR42_21720 [Gammaproteobacteria bacterium]